MQHADNATTGSSIDQASSVATSRYNNLPTFDTCVHQSSYRLDYAFDEPIVPDYLVDQSLYPSAPHLNSFVPFDGGIAPNHFPAAPSVSSLTATYVSNAGPWDLPSPDFSSRHAPHVTMNHSFYPIPNSHNSTSSPYATNSHTVHSTEDMERVAETSQPTIVNGTSLTAPSANTGRHRVMKPRSTCKTCRKSFSRPSDLDRHAKKHQPGARIYTCSMAGCDYEGSYRKDKLTAHVKNCHK